jgi:glycosyltransferase involved in cell wall biosynthesis
MTYSEGGRQALINAGVAAAKVTAVGNASNQAEILASLAKPRSSEVFPRIRSPRNLTALFVGGLDGDKRIDFLLRAARAAHQSDPRFTLIIGGSGAQEQLVRDSLGEPWLHWHPRLTPTDLGELAQRVGAIWMPGRIGLVALDALAMGVPIHAAQGYRFHAPEVEYLTPGETVHFLTDTPELFAVESIRRMSASGYPCISEYSGPTVKEVAGKMSTVIFGLLQRP